MSLALLVSSALERLAEGSITPFLVLFMALVGFCAFSGLTKWCATCSVRDCDCCRWFLRASGHDEFEEFELMMVIHEVAFERNQEKMPTRVRVTSGHHIAETDSNTNGIFQQPLSMLVEQGTKDIVVDFVDANKSIVLAKLTLDVIEDVLAPRGLADDAANRKSKKQSKLQLDDSGEEVYKMTTKSRTIRNPKIKLTMTLMDGEQADNTMSVGPEKSMTLTGKTDVDGLVTLQLNKARNFMQKAKSEKSDPEDHHDPSDVQVIRQACSGPLELFQGLGKTREVYVGVEGPPLTRKYSLGLWHDKEDFLDKQPPFETIELMRIQSIQADADRHHIFDINYYDEARVFQTVAFRRVDRARDVWVEILRLMIQKVRYAKEKRQQKRVTTEQ